MDRNVASEGEATIIFDKRRYQLAAITHEPLALDASLLADVSAGCYDAAEIIQTEREMIEA